MNFHISELQSKGTAQTLLTMKNIRFEIPLCIQTPGGKIIPYEYGHRWPDYTGTDMEQQQKLMLLMWKKHQKANL